MTSLLFIIFIFIFVAGQGFLYKKYIFKSLCISRSFNSAGLFPGDKVIYEMIIENRKLLPLTWIRIEEKFYTGLEFEINTKIEPINDYAYIHRSILSLLPYQKVVRRYKLKAIKRGFYQLKDLTVTSTDLLGIEEYSMKKEVNPSIVIYPKIRGIAGDLIPVRTTLGDFSVKRWIIEDPMIITGIRAYNGNDSLKSINWKATAKNQQLLVNKYDYTADKKIMIIFNLERQEYTLEQEDVNAAIERAIEVCASIAFMMYEAGVPVGFATNTNILGPDEADILNPDTGDRHFTTMLEVMAKLSYFKKCNSRELLKSLVRDFSWGTEVIVVTPRISEELVGDLQSLNNIKTTVITLSPDNINIPIDFALYYYKQEGEHYEAIQR